MSRVCAKSETDSYSVSAVLDAGEGDESSAVVNATVTALSGARAITKERIAQKIADSEVKYYRWSVTPN